MVVVTCAAVLLRRTMRQPLEVFSYGADVTRLSCAPAPPMVSQPPPSGRVPLGHAAKNGLCAPGLRGVRRKSVNH